MLLVAVVSAVAVVVAGQQKETPPAVVRRGTEELEAQIFLCQLVLSTDDQIMS